jgi:chromosomal replication initiator protein
VTGADIDLADLWRRTLLALESAGVSPSERAFVGFARLMAVIEQTALIAVPNDYTKKVLESDVRENLVRALGDSLGREIGLAVTVDPSLEQSIHEQSISGHSNPGQSNPGQSNSEQGSTNTSHSGSYPGERSDGPDATLDAARLAGSTRSTPSTPSSSGRATGSPTRPPSPSPRRPPRLQPAVHLRRLRTGQDPPAARHRPLRPQPLPQRAGAYVNSEEFTNDFINSIRDDKARASSAATATSTCCSSTTSSSWQGKVQTQEEFFHTFNTLHNANKQVVITSDVPPKHARRLRGADAQPLRVGSAHRRPAARPRDTDRHPAQEGDPGTAVASRTRCSSSSRAASPPTSASSRAPSSGSPPSPTSTASRSTSPGRDRPADLIPTERAAQITRATIMAQTASYFGLTVEDLCGLVPLAGPGHRPPDRHVPVPRAHRPVPAEDRAAVRRPRPHHRDARRPQDPPADGRARAIYNQVTELTGRIPFSTGSTAPMTTMTSPIDSIAPTTRVDLART